jgi:fructose-specific PTS system IIB-like component
MNILAVTSCPSGVAHTYMAAEALEREAKARGIKIKVETQGSIGIENQITMDDVKKRIS